MVPPSEKDFTNAWRALAGFSSNDTGWRTIPVLGRLGCRLFAGRHYPGDVEAILIGFRSVRILSKEQLPEGAGFLVCAADPGPLEGYRWLALMRLPSGSLEIFTMMAADIVATLEFSHGADDDSLLGIFLARIRAWQKFMQRGRDGILSQEAEIGLHGELVILSSILGAGAIPDVAIQSWCGPKDALHDFQAGTGALEVKATIYQNSFPATISSLEQLDNHLVDPLYLAGVRFRLDHSGMNLKERIDGIRKLIGENGTLSGSLDLLLLHAGYSPSMAIRYTRRFLETGIRVHRIEDAFPKLSHRNVPPEIMRVQYRLDLDLVACPAVSLNDALRDLEVLRDGTH